MNKDLFLSKVYLNGMNLGRLAEAIGMTQSKLSSKLNGKVDCGFSQPEINKIIHVLGLSGDDAKAIFFADEPSLQDGSEV